jgi:hypothetical protein
MTPGRTIASYVPVHATTLGRGGDSKGQAVTSDSIPGPRLRREASRGHMQPGAGGTHDTKRQETRLGGADPHDDSTKYSVIVATRFVVRRRRDTVPFLRAALVAGREAEAIPGFLGGTIVANLWRREFWTASVWSSPEAVRSYGSAPGHATAMRRTQDWASDARVERWRTSGSEVPSLADIAEKLGAPTSPRGLVRRLHAGPRPLTLDESTSCEHPIHG